MSVVLRHARARYPDCTTDIRFWTLTARRIERERRVRRIPSRFCVDRLSAIKRGNRQTADDQSAPISEENDSAETDQPMPEEKTEKSKFQSCGEAIRAGLEWFQQKRYSKAIEAFNSSLELPGEGRFRFSGRAIEFSGPSQSEEHAALYNIMCCYSKLQEMDSAMTCLEALLDAEYEDFETLRQDSDLSELRSDPRFEETVQKFDSLQKKVTKIFQKKPKADKPWLL